VAQFLNGLSGSQTICGACRSEGLVAGEHVPDRLGELAGEVDLRDLGAALAAVAAPQALVALLVELMGARVDRSLHQPPAQIPGAVLGDRAAQIDVAGLADAGAQAGVSDELDRRAEAANVPELARDREAGDPAESGRGDQDRHVTVIGAGALEL
jgi:hypothetical protein